MTTVEGLFQKYSKVTSCQQLCVGLAPLVGKCSEGGGTPGPAKAVKCTKRFYTLYTKHVDSALSKCNYELVCVLFKVLRYIAESSPSPLNGYAKFSSFGLPSKSWLSVLCLQTVDSEGDEEWNKAVDEILFTVAVIVNFSDDVKESMVSILPSLLQCIGNSSLPCSAVLEAARGSNVLLEMCGVDYKCKLNANTKIEKLIWSMGDLVKRAGDFECQVTMVECLFRLTTERDRATMAKQWFKGAPSTLRAFNAIRESHFEVDSRVFLNILNSSAGDKRSVSSVPCNSAFLGTLELHRPKDEGMRQFWVDFNSASKSVSMFVEDPALSGEDSDPEEGIWEVVIIRNSFVQEWSVKQKGRDLVLTIQLNKPAHTLLPSVPASPSCTVTVAFVSSVNPTHLAERVFSSEKKQQQCSTGTSIHTPVNHQGQSGLANRRHSKLDGKGTSGRTPMHQSSELQEISPIELPPNTPAMGGHLNSQGSSDTPPNRAIPPITTPATSTPKHRPSVHNSSRLPLKFLSSGSNTTKTTKPKASCAVASVHLFGGKSRIVSTPCVNPTANAARRSSSTLGTVTTQKNHNASSFENCANGQGVTHQQKENPKLQPQRESLKTQQQKEPVNQKDSSSRSTSKPSAVNTASKQPLSVPEPTPNRKTSTLQKSNYVDSTHRRKSTPAFQHLDDTSEVNSPVLDYDDISHLNEPDLHSKAASHDDESESLQLKSFNNTTANKLDRGFVNTATTVDLTSSPETDAHSNGEKCHCCNSSIESEKKSRTVSTTKGSNQSHNSSRQALANITNNNTSLNQRGQRRSFNLIAAPSSKGKGRKPQRGRNKSRSNNSSLNNSRSSDLDAIPDSMPLPLSQEELSDQENDTSTIKTRKRRSSKRIQMPPAGRDSFSFDSDPESDKSWELTQKRKKGGGWKVGANKTVAAASKKKEAKGTVSVPRAKALLLSSRTQNTTMNSSRGAVTETDAVPDSMPLPPSQEELSDQEDEDDVTWTSKTRKRRSSKRIQIPPTGCDSFSFDSDPESDKSWELTQKRKKGGGWKVGANKTVAAASRKKKPVEAKGTVSTTKAKALLSTSRTQKTTMNSSRGAVNKADVPPVANVTSARGNATRKRKQTNSVRPTKKRNVDIDEDVFDSENTEPASRSKVLQRSTAGAKLSTVRKDTVKSTSAKRSKPLPRKPSVTNPTRQPQAVRPRPPRDDSDELSIVSVVESVTRKPTSTKRPRHQVLSPLSEADSLQEEDSPIKQPPKKTFLSKRASTSSKKPALSPEEFGGDDDQDLYPPSPKKLHLEKGRRSSGYFSIGAPNCSTASSIENSPTDNNNRDDIYSSPSSVEQNHSPSLSPLHLTPAPITTEPLSPSPLHLNPAPIVTEPLSPSSSLHSSQVEADPNITIGFQQICRNLIAQSGKKNKVPPQKLPASKHSLTAAKEPSRKKRKEMSTIEEEPDTPVTLTQLSKQIVKRSNKNSIVGKSKGDSTFKRQQPPQQKRTPLVQASRNTTPHWSAVDCEDQESYGDSESCSTREPATTHSRQRSTVSCSVTDIDSISNVDSSTVFEDDSPPRLNFSSCYLPGTDVDSGPLQLSRVRRASLDKFASKATPADLFKLWSGQQKERDNALCLYKQRLSHEVVKLEKEVKTIQEAEEQALVHFKKHHKVIANSLKQQHSQVERLCTLQVSFHEQFGNLEQNQAKQQTSAQKSLKKDMHSLQKKMLADSQKKEMARIKHSLQVMLLQV